MKFDDTWRRYWPQIAVAAVGVVLLCAAIFIVFSLPPRKLVMATGAKGGAQYELGLRYREILAQAGVTLELRPTGGSLENLALLNDSATGVSVGFIQSGTTTRQDSPTLESLGTLFYEPLWLFARREITGKGIESLHGRRMSIGPEGSGTRALSIKLIERLKLTGRLGEVFGYNPEEAEQRLIVGDIDVALIITAWDSPIVQRLATAKGVELQSFPRAEAFIALYPFLDKLVLPAGVADLAENRPPNDVTLLASKASLAVRNDLHVAIQQLLLSAAVKVHSQPGVFQRAAQFPAAESIDLPLSETAQRFYKNGRPFLQNYLPFWLATFLEQLLLVLVPLGAVLYPLIKMVPEVYEWMMRSKISRLYQELTSIERDARVGGDLGDAGVTIAKLDVLADRINDLALPRKYASTVYALRSHIDYVRAGIMRADQSTR